ncbi:putative endothelin-converting enzyme 1 [Helianthus annuus]|nr:putative endothelin-converting enzyme 1 [Helianthus annuus]
MFTDESACNTYNYGDSVYWDARYIHEASAGSFDWYQRYHALRPFLRKYVPTSSRILMVGCGNAGMYVKLNLCWFRVSEDETLVVYIIG